jgi:DNA ligase (NAD+)
VDESLLFNSQMEVMDALRKCGFPIADRVLLCNGQSDAYEFYLAMEKQRAELAYDIDGVVYKVNDIGLQKRLGTSAKFPRYAIAYKFPAETAVTVVRDIVVQIGRTGSITPVAELVPVTVGGVVVARATLHNKDEVRKRDIRIGDKVVIQRAGDVIPQVLSPLLENRPADSRPFVFPTNCPSCGTILVKEKSDVSMKCPNINCKGQHLERFLHFVSKGAFNMEGLGEQNIRFFIESGIIKDFTDIFAIEEKNEHLQLQKLDGWGKQSVDNLFASINNAKKISLDRFIYALGIPQIGRTVSKTIAAFWGSYQNFLECIENNSSDILLSINGIGKTIVDEIKKFFENKNNLQLMKNLAAVVNIEDVQKPAGDLLANKTVVFTGTLLHLSRDAAKAIVEEQGGRVSDAVSAKTSFLIVGADAGQKLEQAQKKHVPVLSEEDFFKLIKKNREVNL